jgi:hypothetical protein
MPKKKGSGKRSRVPGRGSGPVLPDPGTPEFAYLVAVYAWRDGLTANAIARKLFAHDGDPSTKSTNKELMQVKRALVRAHMTNVLQLVPLESEALREKLDEKVNKGGDVRLATRFHVVTDDEHTAGAPVHAKAAELVATFVLEACAASADEDVVICNAGGRTVSESVKALVRNPPVIEGGNDALRFVAGNAAYLHDYFDRSANFLSVKMAEVFGAGGHMALPKEDDRELIKLHGELVNRAALFVCGAGNCRREVGRPSLMQRYFDKNGWTMPPEAVGDLAFNLLDRHGIEVPLEAAQAALMRDLNPTLNMSRLHEIRDNGRVLLILDAEDPAEKRDIGIAILRARHATDVVLGTRLADEIVAHWDDVA